MRVAPVDPAEPSDGARAKGLKSRKLQPLDEFRHLYRRATPFRSREALALNTLITHADNETCLVNGPRALELVGELVGAKEFARRSKQSKSNWLRALEAFQRAGIVTRPNRDKKTDDRQHEIAVYWINLEALRFWAFKKPEERPAEWDPPKPPKKGGVIVESSPNVTCVPRGAANPADAQRNDGGGVVSTCDHPPAVACPSPPPANPADSDVKDDGGVVSTWDHAAGAAGAPPQPAPTLAELAAQRPADDLLAVLARGVARGHAWCVTTAERVMERGGRITPGERKTLIKIRDEEAREEARAGPSVTQQSGGSWIETRPQRGKPKGEAPP